MAAARRKWPGRAGKRRVYPKDGAQRTRPGASRYVFLGAGVTLAAAARRARRVKVTHEDKFK
jgi:hypothetical protein